MSKNTKSINIKSLVKKFEEASIQGKTGYNMYDVVPMDVSPIKKVFEKDDDIIDVEIDESKNDSIFTYLKNKIKNLEDEARDLEERLDFKSTPGFDEFVDKIVQTYNVAREDVIKDYGDLPASGLKKINVMTHEEEDDVLTKAALAPRASLNTLKDVAEKLGFMITSWDHHNKRSFENESDELKESIKEFDELQEYMDLYVISPLYYWDIDAIVKDENPNKWDFVSSKISDIVSAIRIQLPTLRNFHQRISELETKTDSLEYDSKTYKKAIEEIYSELDRIDKEIEKMNRKIIMQDKEIQKARREAAIALKEAAVARDEAASARSIAMNAIDPMLFAVPKGHDMEKDCKCIIGPVWGPDFNWLLLAKERMDINLNQRKMIEKINPFLI